MLKKFQPDYTFASYSEITPEFLSSEGICALLIDIDNTLAPYEQDVPDEKLIKWFDTLKENGIRAALVSNNNAERVDLFNRSLGLPAYSKCGKPNKKNIRRALAAIEASPEGCAIVGDQLFTDAFAGKRLGVRAIIVPPIKDKTSLFFKLKRSMEKPIMRSYERSKNREHGA